MLKGGSSSNNNNNDDDADARRGDVLEFLRTYDSSHVQDFSIENEILTVTHNPFFVTAEGVAIAILHKTGADVQLINDGAATKVWDFSSVQLHSPSDHRQSDSGPPSIASSIMTMRPQLLTSGVFWGVSMLSMVGGPV